MNWLNWEKSELVQMWFPGSSCHLWTSKDRQECYWAWQAPSSSSPRAGVFPSPASSFLCLFHSPASFCRSVCFVYLWPSCSSQNLPWFWLWLWPSFSLRILSFHGAPLPSPIYPAAPNLHSKFLTENLPGSFWVTCPPWSNQLCSEVVCGTS